MSVDLTFARDVSNWVRKVEDRSEALVQEIAEELMLRLIIRSPVDTGLFRGNWQIAIGRKPTGIVKIPDKIGAATMARAMATILALDVGETIYVSNNLPYALALEYGWSGQAPQGILRITTMQWADIVRVARERAIQRYP